MRTVARTQAARSLRMRYDSIDVKMKDFASFEVRSGVVHLEYCVLNPCLARVLGSYGWLLSRGNLECCGLDWFISERVSLI